MAATAPTMSSSNLVIHKCRCDNSELKIGRFSFSGNYAMALCAPVESESELSNVETRPFCLLLSFAFCFCLLMLEALGSNTKPAMITVHVKLLDEGTDVWRPTQAEPLGEMKARLLP